MRIAFVTVSVLGFLLASPCASSKEPASDTFVEDGSKFNSLFDRRSLGNWKVTDFGGQGEVFVKDGQLHLEAGSPLTGVTFRREVPRTDYELVLEAQRVSGTDFFCGLTFPVEDSFCSLILGGWGGAVVGLSNIDGQDASDNETNQIIAFKSGQWYSVRLRVARSAITVWLDGKEIISASTAGHEIGIRPEVSLSRPLGIASFQTHAAIRRIGLRRLDSK
jgi:hypothetical protein